MAARIEYNGSSKIIRRLCELVNAAARLGTAHETAFYGDWGLIAYEHSQTVGNPHNTTLSDLGLENIQRQIDLLMDAVGSLDYWANHDDSDNFIDHNGDYLVFVSGSNLLKWH